MMPTALVKTALCKSSQLNDVLIIGEEVDRVVVLNGLGYGRSLKCVIITKNRER